MHIPDGALSPQTFVTLYAASTPFWALAVQRVKKVLTNRTVPLLSILSAFSFVIMMFNIPLVFGTTGHAVGASLLAILLGPWAAIIGVSVALIIQAVFFQDGGITAIGANCFNMAIVMAFVSYWLYKAIAGNSPMRSRRRVVAAFIAGYVALNVAALCTAIELGIQPIFFTKPDGTPLYFPFGLDKAVPAMMLGHLLAGFAEGGITAALVAYLQRTNLPLLTLTESRERRKQILQEAGSV